MPSSATTNVRPRERIISASAIMFKARERDADGSLIRQKSADQGVTVVLERAEEMRLDALGALAKPGSSREQIEQLVEQWLADYQSARRTVPETA